MLLWLITPRFYCSLHAPDQAGAGKAGPNGPCTALRLLGAGDGWSWLPVTPREIPQEQLWNTHPVIAALKLFPALPWVLIKSVIFFDCLQFSRALRMLLGGSAVSSRSEGKRLKSKRRKQNSWCRVMPYFQEFFPQWDVVCFESQRL